MVRIFFPKPTAKRGDISHVDHIPGGKRFWKVGRAYQLRASVYIFKDKIGIMPVLKKYHRKTNQRWIEAYTVHDHLAEKGSLFILLRPPCYKTVLKAKDGSALESCYQIKVLCGEKIGWIKLGSSCSPRQYCSPVK